MCVCADKGWGRVWACLLNEFTKSSKYSFFFFLGDEADAEEREIASMANRLGTSQPMAITIPAHLRQQRVKQPVRHHRYYC